MRRRTSSVKRKPGGTLGVRRLAGAWLVAALRDLLRLKIAKVCLIWPKAAPGHRMPNRRRGGALHEVSDALPLQSEG